MQKNELTTAIVFYLLDLFGISKINNILPRFADFNHEKYLLKQQLSFIDEESEQKFSFPIWAAKTTKEGLSFKFIFTITATSQEEEYFFIFQVDDHPPCAFKGLKFTSEKIGIITYLINDQWIFLDILSQSKVLSSLEQLTSLLLEWSACDKKDIEKMYPWLLNFVNFTDAHEI